MKIEIVIAVIVFIILIWFFPITSGAAESVESLDHQMRDLRRDIQMQEAKRDHDRAIDAIRARDEAERQYWQREIENSQLRQQIEAERYNRPIPQPRLR